MAVNGRRGAGRLDAAARAGWLYYVAGRTQDEIAKILGISRQSAQRLVSAAVAEKLVKVRLDHPIADCMALSARLTDKYGLDVCEVVPTDPGSTDSALGVAEAAAEILENYLSQAEPLVLAFGTGRTLRATVEDLPHMSCPQHKIVSLVGNAGPDGSASLYDVLGRLSRTVHAPYYPLPLPLLADSEAQKQLLHDQRLIRSVLDLAGRADISFVGIGDVGDKAPILEDGFITAAELAALRKAGAVGELVGWTFDSQGAFISGQTNSRVTSAVLDQPARRPVIGLGKGAGKVQAIKAALAGRLLTGLVTDEATAAAILD